MWDGSSWVTPILAETTATASTSPNVAVAFESTSGQAIAVYSENGSSTIKYRTWDSGSGWSAEQTGPNVGGVPNSVILAADTISDQIMLTVQDANSDVNAILWDGTSWGTPTELETNTTETKNQPFLFLWDQQLVNQVPIATGNTVVATEDVPLVIGPSDFNFSDTEGDSLTSVTITGLTLNGGTLTHSAGTVTITNGMTITAVELADLTFISALNDSTNSSFTYTVNDAGTGITSATMNITVNAANDVPVATGNTVIATEDVPLVIGASDFSFSDTEGDSLASVTITGLTLNGGTLTHSAGAVTVTNGMTVTAAELSDLTFTSALNDSTDSSFTYIVNDADTGSSIDSETMTITVNESNTAPVLTAIDDQLIDEHSTLSLSAMGTDSDLPIDTLTVNEVNAAPLINTNGANESSTVSAIANQSSVMTVTSSDADFPADILSYSIVGGVDSSFFSIDQNGVLTFKILPDYADFADADNDGIYEVQIQVSDGKSSDNQLIRVIILKADEIPVAAAVLNEEQLVQIESPPVPNTTLTQNSLQSDDLSNSDSESEPEEKPVREELTKSDTQAEELTKSDTQADELTSGIDTPEIVTATIRQDNSRYGLADENTDYIFLRKDLLQSLLNSELTLKSLSLTSQTLRQLAVDIEFFESLDDLRNMITEDSAQLEAVIRSSTL